MINPDFINQPYIAELLRTPSNNIKRAMSAIEGIVYDLQPTETIEDADGSVVEIRHGFIASINPYHRTTRNIGLTSGKSTQIPRTKPIRRREHYLYDILLLRKNEHVVIAVPFHSLASKVFREIDDLLGGTSTLYEKLNITNMVIQLGARGKILARSPRLEASEIVVTRCHLAYSDPQDRKRDLEQIRLTGSNLGQTDIYAQLIQPVLRPKGSSFVVIPILLGFALTRGGVRKSSAITDRHGNFKVTVGPGLRQLIRIFQLFQEVEGIRDVVSTTSNVPILQSRVIENVE